jgi:UbiD family decarboxylase
MESLVHSEPIHAVPAAKRSSTWRDLREWLDLLRAHNQLKFIDAPVDLDEELSAVTYLAAQQETSPALLFRNIAGDRLGASVLTNMLGASKERYALAVGIDPSLSVTDMIAASRDLMNRRMPPVMIARSEAPVNEVILRGEDVDLTAFPAPKFWPGDGGPYIGTGDITFTRAPDSSRINVGCYRQMLHGRNRVGMYCSPGKHGRLDREAWWRDGKPCEVVAVYGIDPVLFMVAAQTFNYKLSELEIAGGIMGHPLELTQAELVSLPIPARAEIVVEGLLHPGDTEMEGPLGEFTGYYGNERAKQPVIEVKAIHHRKAPIHTAALMAKFPACEIGAYAAIMRSANIMNDLERVGVDGVVSVYAGSKALINACIPPPRRAGAWSSSRSSSSMPATRRRFSPSRRNVPRRPTTPNGSLRWTRMSIPPTSTRSCGRSARAAIRSRIWTCCGIPGRPASIRANTHRSCGPMARRLSLMPASRIVASRAFRRRRRCGNQPISVLSGDGRSSALPSLLRRSTPSTRTDQPKVQLRA